MDAKTDQHTSRLKEWRAYTDKIIFNGNEIGEIGSASVFIYDATEVDGYYFLWPAVNNDESDDEKIKLEVPAHSLTIIKFSLSEKTPITSKAEVEDVSDFYKCFDNNKWLRKELADKGYYSVTELVAGYKINGKEVAVLPDPGWYKKMDRAHMLTDTLFYDDETLPTTRQNSNYYEIIREDPPNGFRVKEYLSGSNQLKLEGYYSAIDSAKIREGMFTYYYESGRISHKGNYHNNMTEGLFVYYFDTTNSPEWYHCNYKDGMIDGELKSYYLSGKLKRKEFHQAIENKAYANSFNSGIKQKSAKRDTIISGSCYDESGKEIKFTRFESMPTTKYNINEYIGKSVKYPKSAIERNIEGRVLVKFVVNTDGTISDIKIRKHVSPELDKEAARVIEEMPLWEPGIQDDKKVKVYFTIPIRFKLE